MFGEMLRYLRSTRNITQREIAEYLGVSPSTVGMYEQDRRQPDIETLMRIANFYGVPLSSLAGYPEEESENKRELLKLVDQLDDDQLKELESYIDYLILKHKKEDGNN